jgi:hypothetical protein
MPILNGFEACKKIIQFYDQESKLFQVQQKENKRKRPGKKKSKSSVMEDILEEVKQVPLMIAYSGLVNQKVRLQAE